MQTLQDGVVKLFSLLVEKILSTRTVIPLIKGINIITLSSR